MRVLIGQSARRFLSPDSSKPLVLAGVIISDYEGLSDIADGDVVTQSICQAIGSFVGYHKMINLSKDLIEKDGITDSLIFLEKCIGLLSHSKVIQISISIEVKKPAIVDYLEQMQANLAKILKVPEERIGITFFDASGLTDVSLGDGIASLCAITLQD